MKPSPSLKKIPLVGTKAIADAEQRKQLRQTLRAKRKSLTESQQQQAAELLADTLLAMTTADQTLGLYFANDGELSPNLAIERLLQAGRKVAVPVMHSFRKGYLNFQRYQAGCAMRRNGFGIEEPVLNATKTVPLVEMDILFMPLVGFDAQGNRMGMGGGYYDRTLNRLNAPPLGQNDTPLLVGLAHDCQQVEALPIASWDVPLHMIITPTKKIMTNSN